MSIRPLIRALGAATLLCLPAAAAQAEAPDVVVSIRPLHSLVSAVMQGVGEPHLLVDSAQSPHSYALKPSDAAKLSGAQAVFWIGPHYETFLTDSLPNLASGAKLVAADDAPGIERLPNREGGAFEAHDHGQAHEEDHAEAGGDHDHDHDHETEQAEASHDHEGHEGHGHGEFDPHVWLSPTNAERIVDAIAAELAGIDPANAATYKANANAEKARIAAAAEKAKAILAADTGKGFVVTHDGFQYFEHAFGPEAVASVTINPDVTPSAGRVAEIKAKIAETGTRCLVSEPQFPKSLTALFADETSRIAPLDYVGIDHAPGPDLYTDLMIENAEKLHACLDG